ncbi:MAG TPA: hypothetical protein VM290_09725 [Gaiellaceae bacterium]|jgi:hypothetical protein|nr:hypothetical protein [Gaiellaceae bacterium]
MDDDRQRRLAENEALARDVNEVVERVAGSWFREEERLGFRCECSRAGCRSHVALTRGEYESVRGDALRFVVVPGHENAEIEREVGRIREYLIVEKRGAGADVARASDPRA